MTLPAIIACRNKLFAKAIKCALLTLFTVNCIVTNAQTATSAKLSVQLLLNTNGGSSNTADGLVVLFASRFSASIGNEDSYKFTNLDENMAINRNGTLLSIEGRPTINQNDTVPLKVWKYRQKTYCFKFVGSNFSSSLQAVMKDNYLHVDFPFSLTETNILDFAINSDSASFAPDRFCIIFKPATTLPISLSSLRATQQNGGINLDWTTLTEENVDHYEVERSSNGVVFNRAAVTNAKANNAASQAYTWYDAAAFPGNNFYRVKVVEKGGGVQYSAIARVNVAMAGEGITVYPNPSRGRSLTLQMNNMSKGIYTLTLYNTAGQSLYATTFQHKSGSSSQTIQLAGHFSKGIYTMILRSDTFSHSQYIVID